MAYLGEVQELWTWLNKCHPDQFLTEQIWIKSERLVATFILGGHLLFKEFLVDSDQGPLPA